jgi:hypothetical protein
MISDPLKWVFGWRIEVPQLLRDYISVGAIFFASNVRAMREAGMTTKMPAIAELFLYLVAWPLLAAVALVQAPVFLMRARSKRTNFLETLVLVTFTTYYVLALLPLLYLGLLMGLNYLMSR